MYINAFCAAVPEENKQDYIKHASIAGEIMKSCGCVSYKEAWGDAVPDGETTSFLKAVKCGEGEVVVIGFAQWPDKETADAGMAKMMQDPRMANMSMPFDGQRLIWGGFETIIDF